MDRPHIHLDEFTGLGSYFHKFDPRLKLISCLAFLVCVASLETYPGLGTALLLAALFFAGSRLPLGRIVRRLGFIVPAFLLLVAFLPFLRPGTPLFSVGLGPFRLVYSREGLLASGIFALRLTCAALTVILLTFTTPFHVLLRSLEELRLPRIFTQLTQFTVRYSFVLYNEVLRMQRALRARNFTPGRHLWHRHTLRTLGGLLGALFIRSYERGERVYYAMLARGFKGETRTLHEFRARPGDVLIAGVLVAAGLLSFFVDRGGWTWLQSLR